MRPQTFLLPILVWSLLRQASQVAGSPRIECLTFCLESKVFSVEVETMAGPRLARQILSKVRRSCSCIRLCQRTRLPELLLDTVSLYRTCAGRINSGLPILFTYAGSSTYL